MGLLPADQEPLICNSQVSLRGWRGKPKNSPIYADDPKSNYNVVIRIILGCDEDLLLGGSTLNRVNTSDYNEKITKSKFIHKNTAPNT